MDEREVTDREWDRMPDRDEWEQVGYWCHARGTFWRWLLNLVGIRVALCGTEAEGPIIRRKVTAT